MERESGNGGNAEFTGAKSPEILGGLGNDVVVEFDNHPTLELSSNADVHETSRPNPHYRSLGALI